MRLRSRVMTLLACSLVLPVQALGATVHVAVAANFTAPMKIIAQDFERESGHQTVLSFGATGQFHAQIKNGAPFAILLAADDETPIRLEREGFAITGSRFTFATGKLALWSNRPSLVDAQGDVLRSELGGKIAMASPKLSPYGVAAMETLGRMGLIEKVKPKIVEGANITQAFQFVTSQNAALGFVALSQVLDKGVVKAGSAWIVPGSMHSPIQQDAVLLKAGQNNPAAIALLAYLRSDKAKAVIRSFGYEL